MPELVTDAEAPPDRSQAANAVFFAPATDEGQAKWEAFVREHCEKATVSGPMLCDVGGSAYLFGHAQAPWFIHEQWKVGVGIEIAAQLYGQRQVAEHRPAVAVAHAGTPADLPQAAPRRRR